MAAGAYECKSLNTKAADAANGSKSSNGDLLAAQKKV
jgi:hypothetical protein